VLLDDVEWFDAESQDLATFLLLRPPAGSMLLVSWRPANQPAVVVEAAGEALTTGHGRLLRLSALSRHEVTELSRQLGHDVDPDLLDRLVLRTGGVPLLVVEHALAGEARAERASPVTVEAAVAARLDRAPASTAQLLTAVAVLGAAADAELLQQVSGRSEIEVADALDDAVERRLLTTGASGLDFDFPHDSLRLVANGRTSPARRHLLHARAADALLQRRVRHPHSVRAATLGRLLEGAGRLDEASGWYVTAAHEAGTLSAHATAAAHLERALALGADPVHTHLKLGDARLRMGEYSAALADYENVVALSEDPLVLSAAEHKLAEVYDRLGDWELALGHLEAALGMTEPGPADHGGREPASTSGEQWQPSDAAAATARASVLADLALVGLRLGRLDASRAAAEQARRSAELADDATALVQALNVLAVLSLRLQETGQARALFEQAQDRAATLTDPGPLVAVLNNRARFEADQGEWDVAVDLASEALELGIRHGDRHRLAALHANLADVLHHTGREDEAREHLIRSASLFADVDREAERRPEVWKLVEW
jgi:tetratricopeptide (TPR) repeat protein